MTGDWSRAKSSAVMEGILDLERLLSRVTLETANPATCWRLPHRWPSFRRYAPRWRALPAARLATLHAAIDELRICASESTTLVAEPPSQPGEGGVIPAGVDTALDELRDLSRNSKQYLAQVEQRERQRTGIGSLKVKFKTSSVITWRFPTA